MESDEDESGLVNTYCYEDLTFLEACLEADLDAIAAILEENPTEEEMNERDRSGRTGLSHLCSSGLAPAVDLLSDVQEVDVNLPDKEGNTPLIFAAQAGHSDVVRVLLQDFKGIRIDQPNKLGFTALMKAAIQGRTDCARLLLYAGADPKLRDHGRKLCAQEWARYCGRKDCADAIAKFSNTKRFCLKSRFTAGLERSSSLPDLFAGQQMAKPPHKRSHSLRKKIRKMLPGNHDSNTLNVASAGSPFAVIARCVSTPALPGGLKSPPAMKRPVSADSIPRVEVTVPYDEATHIRQDYPACSRRRIRKCPPVADDTNFDCVTTGQ
ncbi:neurogenic locus notch homolog protein 4-like [Pomacea canaliculata]|nr:neurogenic locus notch homolog protein 4-like [Pomacea canaliculata]XP_025082741.1 neurogenic locus notch homolog protein 4-like [Pomacea canaliculata]XP_025082742.1 neurogenic locus notch homolog protein 4-like [Pomacea canaliculata]